MYKIIFAAFLYCCFSTGHGEVCRGNFTLTPENWQLEAKRVSKCKVIEGSLTVRQVDLRKFSLPKLTMITDYIIIHRIKGIIFLSDFLPNLGVIRGRKLFSEFAFIAVSNDDLQQIGKTNIAILRGAVAFEDNIMLCPGGPSIWEKRTRKSFWKTNRFVNNHHECFEDCLAEAEQAGTGCSGEEDCTARDKECPAECVGGCDRNTSRCAHCRHFVKNGVCYRNCPGNALEYMKYKCITEEECYKLKYFIYKNGTKSHGKCLSECPSGYEPSSNKPSICVKQEDGAGCITSTITSANMGNSLKDCTIIRGSLTIALDEIGNVTKILQNTKHIVTVTGYIEVVGASLLYSISTILPNLTDIYGEETVDHGNHRYALYVADNINLRELWNFQRKKLYIMGNAYVAFNNLLCPEQVNRLEQFVSKPFRVYRAANGQRAQCEIKVMNLVVMPGSTEGTVHLNFEHTYDSSDDRYYLGYIIYYKESKYDLTSVYEGRDPYLYEKLWKLVTFMFTDLPTKQQYTYTIGGLKANTRYAIYLESYGSIPEKKSLQSKVVYVHTLEKNPSGNIKRTELTFEDDNKLQVNINSEETDVFYVFSASVQISENESDLSKEMLPPIVQEKAGTQRPPVNDNFTNLLYMQEISCDGPINILKMGTINKRDMQVKSDVTDRLLYLEEVDVDHLNKRFTDKDNDTKMTDDKEEGKLIRKKKDKTSVNWTSNEISFSFIEEGKKWTENQTSIGTFWNMVETVDGRRFNLMLPFDHSSNKELDYIFSLRVCRNRIEDCSEYLHDASPCAQCSPAYRWRHDYQAIDDFNVTAKIYDSNETDQLTSDVRHKCSGQVGGYKTLEVGWQEERMAIGYYISVMAGKDKIYNIWVNKDTAGELNYTCYLEIESKDIYVSVRSRRRIRSLSIGTTSLLNSEEQSSDYTWEAIAWSMTTLILVIVIIVALMWNSKNSNKTTVYKENPKYSNDPAEKDQSQSVLSKEKDSRVREKVVLEQVIDGGNFANIYWARLADKTEVAVKKIRENGKHSLEDCNLKTFHEMEIGRSLDNEFIMKCRGWIMDKERVCLLFEYIPGGNLQKYLLGNKGISDKEKKKLSLQSALALEYLYENKIVHRDFAARNIMYSIGRDCLKVGDFGLSVRWTQDDSYEVPAELPVSSAPECWGAKLYRNTDLWAYAVLLYEIHTGERLIIAETPVESKRVRGIITDVEITSSERLYDESSPFNKVKLLPNEILSIVSDCLKKHSERLESPKCVIDRLRGMQEADEIDDEEAPCEVYDEDAPCLTPDGGGTSCISLQILTKKSHRHRFSERLLGTSLPI